MEGEGLTTGEPGVQLRRPPPRALLSSWQRLGQLWRSSGLKAVCEDSGDAGRSVRRPLVSCKW